MLTGLPRALLPMLLLPPLPPALAGEPAPMPATGLHLAGGLLSVNVHEAKLVEVLAELSRQGSFGLAPCTACEQRISLRFERLPLEQGLALILRDENFALRWQAASGTAAVPRQLWLLPRGPRGPRLNSAQEPAPASNRQHPRGSNPAASPSPAPVRPLTAVAAAPSAAPLSARQPQALNVGTPQERAEAAAALARSREPGAVATLARALADSDKEVRQVAIESLAEIGGAEAVGALALALRDGDARLREAAVNALGDLGGAKAITLLRQAQQDASPFVRHAASETLADLMAKKR